MKNIRAHPLRALMLADWRMLWRHGIIAIYLLLVLIYIAVLRFLVSAELRPPITALLLLTDPGALSLFFMGAITLYEKKQRLYAALYASGVRPRTYTISKCLVMSLWGMLAGCAVAWFSNPHVLVMSDGAMIWESLLHGDWIALAVTAAALLLSGMLFACLSMIISAFSRTLNGFLLVAVATETLFLVPAVCALFWPLPAWASLHPVVWLTRAMLSPASFLAGLSAPIEWSYAAVFALFLMLALRGACLAVRRMLRLGTGVDA